MMQAWRIRAWCQLAGGSEMQQSPDAFLIVEKGEPHGVGEALPLLRGQVLLGRDSLDDQRGFFFFSPFVSRRHAMLEFKDGSHFLTDLESRHGTGVNDEQLTPGEPRKLRDRDRISLARDAVVLIYATAAPVGRETWDYPEPQPDPQLILDPDRREVILDDKPLPLSGKLYDLLALLYENRGRAVSTHDIKRTVWKERELGADGMPLVTDDELRTLVYRLRKRLGPYSDLIRTVPGYGYMLDL
jgi:pSer/pThr/pTyr-binding forkhead associated (FHA) protein